MKCFLFLGFLNSFEELQAEECGILNGCENGRCVRVQEGYTCDCFDGYHLDMAKMTCVGKNVFSVNHITGHPQSLPNLNDVWVSLILGIS